MFFFVTGGGKPAEMGEHQLGVVAAEKFTLCKAVAASSAFPPVFPPLRISAESYEYADSGTLLNHRMATYANELLTGS